MGFCNKTKEIIRASYLTIGAADICVVVKDAGLTERKVTSIQTYIDKLLVKDGIRKIARDKFAVKALADPIAYRAMTLLNGAKTRAEKKGIDFDLTKDWLVDKLRGGLCEATNMPLFIKPYSSKEEYTKVHPFSPSLDQIRPSGGYTKDNVQVVCDQFNKLKGDRHETSAYKLAQQFTKTYKKRNPPVIRQVLINE